MAKQLNVNLNFSANTQQAKNEIKDLKKAVSKDNDADNRGN